MAATLTALGLAQRGRYATVAMVLARRPVPAVRQSVRLAIQAAQLEGLALAGLKAHLALEAMASPKAVA